MKRVTLKMKDVRLFDVPTAFTGKNRIAPGNDFIEFKKEDIEQSIPSCFEQQVGIYRDKIAVKVDDRHLTYRELDSRANRVAHAIPRESDETGWLNVDEKTRYKRQMMLHGWGIAAQETLKKTTVFVAGAGGSGSPLIMQLALAGIGTIIICDFDEVELSNLNRQVLHDETRIGMNKALSAAKTVHRINPNVRVIAYNQKINRENIQQMAANASMIFDNVDDIEAKFILSQYAVQKGIPHILSSMIDMNAYVAIFYTPHTPCYHCLYDRDILKQLAEMKRLMKDYQKNPNPVASPALFLSTGFAVNEAVKILLGFDKERPAYNKFFLFNQRGVENIKETDGYRQLIYPFSHHFRELSRQQGCDWEKGWQGRYLEEIEVRPDPHCPACAKEKREELPPLPAPGNSAEVEAIADITPDPGNDNNTTYLPTAALLFGHDMEMIIGILGALKAGKAYVPLDPAYPRERLKYMLEDADARVIITDKANYPLAGHLKERVNRNISIVNIDEIDRDKKESAENPGITSDRKDLAYILYTSGSTGQPKGVMQDHRNVLHFARVYTNALHLHSNDRLTLFSSYGFDAAKMDIYGALLNGGTLYPYDIKKEGSLSRLAHWLETEGITVYHSIPTVYRYFTDQLTGAENFKHLRLIVLGGEAVFKKDVETYKKYFPAECLFINGLGPTESTVTLQYFIDKNTEISKEAVPVGYPVTETEVLLLDENDREAEGYGIGEIVYKSDYLALGYLHNRERTEEVFIKNPLTSKDRVYRSGDLGRKLLDGSIEYVGRKDYQVKVRGYRVEIQEIEGKLDHMPGIKKSAVICKQDEMGESYLTAYYVQSEEKPIDEIGLANGLKEFLPDYMVPNAFYRLNELPLTATGKIDRSALVRLADSQSHSREEYVEPAEGIQQTLAGIWKEVLKVEKIGIHHNFFVLGGNSLKAILLTTLLHKQLDVKVTLLEIFRSPTISQLAGFIEKTVKEKFISIKTVEKKEYHRISSAQKRLFVLQNFEPESIFYNMLTVLMLKGNLDREKMEVCFRRLIQRQESLRTSFPMIHEEPVQRIHDEVEFEIEYKKVEAEVKIEVNDTGGTRGLAPLPVEIAERKAQSAERKEERHAPCAVRCVSTIKNFIRPFDLSRAPLIRVGLIELSHTPAALRSHTSQEEKEQKYILVVDMHHIIGDGTSKALLAREFLELYARNGNGLNPSRIQYKDYALWQEKEKEKGTIKKQEEWWLKEFSGDIPVLTLPLDYPRPIIQDFEGNTITFEVPGDDTSVLKTIALEKKSTLYIVILTLFYALLSKISGQEDIIIGTPVVGRRHADLENIIGMFVNTLALRNFPNGEQTFEEFLETVKKRTLEAFENQEYQFEDLVEKVLHQRDTSRNPLFDVMFALQNIFDSTEEEAQEESDTLDIETYSFEDTTSKFDLSLTAVERRGTLYFDIEYSTKLFRRETILSFIKYFKRLISSVSEEPKMKISELELIPEEERKELLTDFNDTITGYPKDKTIHQLFAEQVERTPDHIATISPGVRVGTRFIASDPGKQNVHLTYNQLNQTSHQLAYLLRKKGIGPDTIVGIMVERSIEMIGVILGILKAGGAYLPLEPNYPGERLHYMLADSNVKILVSQANMVNKVSRKIEVIDPGHAIVRTGDNLSLADLPPIHPHTHSTTQLCYVIYTSGSTGKPKGVLVRHVNVVRLVKETNYIDWEAVTRLLLTGSISFDITTFEIWGALLNGLTLYLVAQDIILDGIKLKEVLSRNQIDVLHLIPQLFNQLAALHPEIFTGLHYFLVGGDLVRPYYVNKIRNMNKDLRILHMYGPTENTTFSTFLPVDKDYEITIPIGIPISNSNVYIVNKYNQLVPLCVPGELVTGGDGVARGYLNNPGLTAEKFIELEIKVMSYMPHMSYIYKTGDLARWLPGGNIELLGRIDHQVKIRGFRIELGEIETRMIEHKAVKEAVVIAQESDSGDRYLSAYLVKAVGFEQIPGHAELREYLAAKLPDYMVPSYFVQVDKIPLTPNGKIDRKALPEPGIEVEEYTPPANDVEKNLAGIWSQLLGIKKDMIDVNSSFFELGGHSLKATIMAAKIHKELGVRLPLAEIFRTPSIRGLAENIKANVWAGNKYHSIEPTEKKDYYALSPAQNRLYLIQNMEETTTTYNMSIIVELEGEILSHKLEKTFKQLIERHESLRTSILIVGDQPVQRVHDAVAFEIEYFQVEGKVKVKENEGTKGLAPLPVEPTARGLQPVTALISSFIRPFDLSRAPLLRVGLIKLVHTPTALRGHPSKEGKEDKYILMADMHHIISDGVSENILVKEFAVVYAGINLPPLRLQYKDFSQWRNSREIQNLVKQQEEFWLKEFEKEIPEFNMPLDYPRPALQDFAGDAIVFEIGSEVTHQLRNLALNEDMTLFIVLFAIYNVLLSKLSGREDIVVGTGVAGRRHENLQNIIGMLVNTLAIRNQPAKEKTFTGFLAEVKEKILLAFENQDYQFEALVEQVVPKRNWSRNPLFDTAFVSNKTEVESQAQDIPGILELPGLMVKPHENQHTVSRFDMTFFVTETEEKLGLAVEYSTKLFKRETIQRFINYFKEITSNIIENNNIKLKDIIISHHLLNTKSDNPEMELGF